MKILMVHNHYLHRGGEDEVVGAEKSLLEQFGHKVIFYERSNKEMEAMPLYRKLRSVSRDVYWSENVYREIRQLIKEEKPDIAHIHNTLLMVSPSVYEACAGENLAVVQTLHNYRFLCPIGIFYRQGKVCEECFLHGTHRAVVNKCWQDSYLASFMLVNIIKKMKESSVFKNNTIHFIVLSEFSRRKFLDNGFTQNQISVKPNFFNLDPGYFEEEGDYALFVGRLSDEKGIITLVKAWAQLKGGVRLKIVGDGPLKEEVQSYTSGTLIEILGQKSLPDTWELLKKAMFVIIPSNCYETFSRSAMEALIAGVPVILSDIGALREFVREQDVGVLFPSGNIEKLREKIKNLIEDSHLRKRMRKNVREMDKSKFSRDKNYEMLMAIYNKVIDAHSQHEASRGSSLI